MKTKFSTDFVLKILCAILLIIALVQTFTVADYYIFNRFGEFNAAFIISQWIKKAGLLLLPMAIYFGRKSCADVAKYVLPPFVIISLFTFGNFFEVTAPIDRLVLSRPNMSVEALKLYANMNEFISSQCNAFMFFIAAELYLAICALLFIRDGFKVRAKSFIYLPLAIIGCMPLNIFENFFDITAIPTDSPLRFYSLTIWHLLAVIILIVFTISAYLFLRNKDKRTQESWMLAAAIIMLIQYHSKDSVIMGDGYNVYYSVFACVPLFICNIGVYVVALSIFLKKRVLYQIGFFVHSAGAFSVFCYFGKPENINYGIFCSYSLLYFFTTHLLLFVLSLMPAALGYYKFKPKDAIIPLIYYCAVIVIAAIASALVTSASMGFSYEGYYLTETEWEHPNYAFTQINPLPFEVPEWIMLTIWRYPMNVLYVVGLYFFYVGIFYAFNGGYYLLKLINEKYLHIRAGSQSEPAEALPALDEAAAADDE